MTRKEAIKMLKVLNMMLRRPDGTPISDACDALDMAIEALSADVVRCKDCKHYSVEGETTRFGWCGYWNKPTDEMRYCSDGERREP